MLFRSNLNSFCKPHQASILGENSCGYISFGHNDVRFWIDEADIHQAFVASVTLVVPHLSKRRCTAQSRIKATSLKCGVRIEHSRCCWLEGTKPNIIVTKRDVTTRIFTYNGGLMWFNAAQKNLKKIKKNQEVIEKWVWSVFLVFGTI